MLQRSKYSSTANMSLCKFAQYLLRRFFFYLRSHLLNIVTFCPMIRSYEPCLRIMTNLVAMPSKQIITEKWALSTVILCFLNMMMIKFCRFKGHSKLKKVMEDVQQGIWDASVVPQITFKIGLRSLSRELFSFTCGSKILIKITWWPFSKIEDWTVAYLQRIRSIHVHCACLKGRYAFDTHKLTPRYGLFLRK